MIEGQCEDDLSRQLCRYVAEEDRLLSAVCWERRWTSLRWFALWLVVDSFFYQRRREVGHCRSAYRREMAEAGELPERLRAAGL